MQTFFSGTVRRLSIGLVLQAATTGYAFEITTTPDAKSSGFRVEMQTATPPLPKPTDRPRELNAGNAAGGPACFGTDHGAGCLDTDGRWLKFTAENSPLESDQVTATAVCAGGLALFAHEGGVDAFDGSNWTHYARRSWDRTGQPTTLTCDGHKGFWVGHTKGAAHFDDARWQDFDRDQISRGRARHSPEQIRIGPGDVAWLNVKKGIARFDSGTWVSFHPGNGLPRVNYNFNAIAIDSNGHPLAMEARGGFLTFDGEGWSFDEAELIDGAHTFEVDQQGRKWVASERRGVQLIDGNSVTQYNTDNSPLTSNRVLSLAVDAAGRVWLGTDWGLNLIDHGQWTAYHMHNSGLPDNTIPHMAVAGVGPTLPAPANKPPGSLTGRLVRHGKPVADAKIEICAQTGGMLYRGPSPCVSKPSHFQGLTERDGVFRLSSVPAGRYLFYFNAGGRWTRLGKGIAGMLPARLLVQADQETDMGDLEIATSGRAHNDSRPKIADPSVPEPEIPQAAVPTPRIPKPTTPAPRIPSIHLPGVAVAAEGDDLIITVSSNVLFNFDQYSLRPDAEATLSQIAPLLAGEFATRKIRVEGHTDSKGTSRYNQTLSERRAAAVKKWLGTRGKIKAERLESAGYGESRPVAPNRRENGEDNPEGRQKNRRVELVLSTQESVQTPTGRASLQTQ